MEILMKFVSNQNSWLYSTLSINNEYLCHTLEFGSLMSICEGVYTLEVGRSSFSNEPIIEVVDFMGSVVCEIVKSNECYVKNIKIRLDNPNISIGCKSKMSLLEYGNSSMKILLLKINESLNIGEKCYLVVKRS